MASETGKAWWRTLDRGPASRGELARAVDADGGRDETENAYFDAANDPQFRANETARRRFAAQMRRRLRHLSAKSRGF